MGDWFVRVAHRQAGIGKCDAGRAVLMRGHGTQSDNAAPIVQDKMHAVEFELVKQRFAYPFLVSRNGIILHARGFLRTSHADHVNGNGAKARIG